MGLAVLKSRCGMGEYARPCKAECKVPRHGHEYMPMPPDCGLRGSRFGLPPRRDGVRIAQQFTAGSTAMIRNTS